MRILFVSGELTASGLCQRLISEGNDVRLYIHKKDWRNCYDGIAKKVTSWRDNLKWVGKNGLIVFDDVIFGNIQNKLRKDGYTVVGGSKEADKLELNRKHFHEIAESCGLKVLPSYDFTDIAEARKFIKSHPDRWVIKQSSHLSYLNFIGNLNDGTDILRLLDKYERLGISPIHIQKYVEGIEIGIARYFNGVDWVGPIEVNHEHKKLNDGDMGPLTPEMGTVIWYTDNEIPIYNETLAKLKPYLKSIDFRGDFDINFIVNKEGVWPLEATARFGAPSTQIQVALHTSPWSEFLRAVAKKSPYKLKYKRGYGIAISVVVPPFPYEPSELSKEERSREQRKIIIDNLTKQDINNIHFEECSHDSSGYYWSGNSGLVLHITGHGKTITEARNKAYKLLKKVYIDGMYYRKDIGTRVEKNDIPQLKQWGWI